jgi:methyltransferase OMS1
MVQVKARYVAGAAVVYGVGIYAGMLFSQGRKSDDKDDTPVTTTQRDEAFARNAKSYDSDIGLSETMTGITRFRKRLLGQASGKVLEVAAGTGRNLEYYPAGCSVVLCDRSAEMLAVAKSKVDFELRKAEIRGDKSDLSGSKFQARVSSYLVRDAESLGFADQEFDTVVDTFGLCSFENPANALKEFARVVKPGGRILLLEHGRTWWKFDWLNQLLDNRARAHAVEWGCSWNRDIDALVKEAGLTIVDHKSHHLGTCYELIVQPSATTIECIDSSE